MPTREQQELLVKLWEKPSKRPLSLDMSLPKLPKRTIFQSIRFKSQKAKYSIAYKLRQLAQMIDGKEAY